jgi:hypothetical protein
MTTIDDKAKAAAAARLQLAETLASVDAAMAQMATIISESAVALEAAVREETAATAAYVTALEAELSHQRQLS